VKKPWRPLDTGTPGERRELVSMTRMRVAALLVVVLTAGLLPAGAGSAVPVSSAGGVLRGDLGAASGAPMAWAQGALATHAEALGVDAAAFWFESVRRSVVGVHVRGREFRGGVPVELTSVAVHAVRGRVWQVEARPSGLAGTAVTGPISAAVARRLGLAALGVIRPYHAPRVKRLLTVHGGRLVDAYHVTALSLAPAIAGTAVVDAATGRTLEIRDDRRFEDGLATVFDPSPTVSARDASMRQPGVDAKGVDTDLDSPELTEELVTLPLRELVNSEFDFGRLLGPYVDVQGPLPLTGGPSFEYTRGDPRFEATMAYAHVDRLQRYFQSLGFRGEAGVNAEPQTVIAIIVPAFDNSFYQPGTDLMLFGSGGVDDAEDAEIIVHEYGHAVHDAQVPGWGETHEGESMGEGWGDFLAAAYYARAISMGFQDECVGEWDATSYRDPEEGPVCLRRTDETKHYPEDLDDPDDLDGPDVHLDGEIWSAFLWRLRTFLGCTPNEKPKACRRSPAQLAKIPTDRVLKLLLTSHEFMSTTADFGDGVAALITAAKALKQPAWVPLIRASARRYGLPLS
jgi:hypothetical protein